MGRGQADALHTLMRTLTLPALMPAQFAMNSMFEPCMQLDMQNLALLVHIGVLAMVSCVYDAQTNEMAERPGMRRVACQRYLLLKYHVAV